MLAQSCPTRQRRVCTERHLISPGWSAPLLRHELRRCASDPPIPRFSTIAALRSSNSETSTRPSPPTRRRSAFGRTLPNRIAFSLVKTYVPAELADMESLHSNLAILRRNAARSALRWVKPITISGDTQNRLCVTQKATHLRKRALGYEIDQDRWLFRALRDLFGKAGPRPLPSRAAAGSPRPIFVVGMPRSGTTLTQQILASHSKIHGAGELEAMNSRRIQHRRTEISLRPGAGDARLDPAALSGGACRTEVGAADRRRQDALNFRWIGFILEAIPEAQVVKLTRDPIAVC